MDLAPLLVQIASDKPVDIGAALKKYKPKKKFKFSWKELKQLI